MLIYLDIYGWMKPCKVNPSTIKNGSITVAIPMPLSRMVRPEDKIPNGEELKITFYDLGFQKDQNPVFSYT